MFIDFKCNLFIANDLIQYKIILPTLPTKITYEVNND